MRPRWLEPGFAAPADHAACRALLRQGSRSFFAAAGLLPAAVREPATALYAFCRLADDAVDRDGGRLAAIERLRARLDGAYAGRPWPQPVDRALADLVARFALPRALPEALLEGLEWDAAGRRYETLAELEAYASRVAGTVGAMMALLMGARAPAVIARACDLGAAMQLTNIARDVGEDARAGRLYLPQSWLRAAGIAPAAWLARPAFSPALGQVVARLLAAADALYQRADAGIGRLPSACRPGIHAARLIYADLGRAIARQGHDTVSRRAVVPGRRKAWLLLRALAASARPAPWTAAPPLDEARFLLAAVAAAPAWPAAPPGALAPALPWWRLPARAGFVLELFERLERRQQAGRAGGP
jgi:phytoene synthase